MGNAYDWLDRIGSDAPEYDDMISSLQVEDPESSWLMSRKGKITGSVLGKLVKKERSGGYGLSQGKMAEDLLYKIAWERFLVDQGAMRRLEVGSRATDHGQTWEREAIEKFEQATGLQVELGGYNFISLDNKFGGTPDGFVSDGGIIEVKCPWNGGNHLKTLIKGEIYNDDHFYQCQGYLLLTDRSHAHYVTYDPDLPEGIQLAIVKVDRDEEVIQAIHEVVGEAFKIVDQMIQECEKINNQIQKQ